MIAPVPIVRTLTKVVVLLIALVTAVSVAYAHASLLEANPADGAVLAHSPPQITLRFNEPVAPMTLRIIAANGLEITPPAIDAHDDTITISLKDALPNGTSLLSYRIISADGHPVGGTISFSVGTPSANSASIASSDRVEIAAIWLSRVLIYFGMFIGVGGVFFRIWIDCGPRPKTWADHAITGIIALALFASALALGLQGLDALGLPLNHLMQPDVWAAGISTTYANALAFGGIAMILALIADRLAWPPLSKPLALASLLGVGAALAVSGHASTVQPQILSRLAVFLHGVGVTFWVGALLPLLASVIAGQPSLGLILARFSGLALPLVIIMIIAGLAIGSAQLGEVQALWLTSYGLVLSTKLVLVGGLLILAGINRFWLTPAISVGSSVAVHRLRWTIKAEIGLIVLILCVVGLWRFTPPPRALAEAESQPVHVHIHRLRAMVDITVSPGRAGSVGVTMQFLSGDFGPLTPKEVTISFSRPASGIESIERNATLNSPGIWSIEHIVLPQSGVWQVQVDALVTDFDKIILTDKIEIRP